MSVVLVIAGKDVSDSLVGTLTIDAGEGQSVVATFLVCDEARQLGHNDMADGSVSISYSGTALFSGTIRNADFDPFTRTFDITATDKREDAKDYDPGWIDSEVFQAPISGTVQFHATNKDKVYGTNTAFTTELRVGQRIYNATDDEYGTPWTGMATTGSGERLLVDSGADWVEDSLVGKYAYNTVTGKAGKIRSNTETEVYVYNNIYYFNDVEWASGDGYKIIPGFDEAVAIAFIKSDTELTLEADYPGTAGSDKTARRVWGLYFEPINGSASNPLEKAISGLDAEWAVLEVDKNGDFRVSSCQASQTPDVTLNGDDFLFHSVKMVHHDPKHVINYVVFEVIEDYQIKRTYTVSQERTIDLPAKAIMSMLRSVAQAGQWELTAPLDEDSLGSGPPYTFDVEHKAEWTQQKRARAYVAFKAEGSIGKYGLRCSQIKALSANHAALNSTKTFWTYGTESQHSATYTKRGVKNRKEPRGFSLRNLLAGFARSEMLESHRLITASMELPLYANISRAHTVQGDFPNLQFRGKVTKYMHSIHFESGEEVTAIDVAVIPPLT